MQADKKNETLTEDELIRLTRQINFRRDLSSNAKVIGGYLLVAGPINKGHITLPLQQIEWETNTKPRLLDRCIKELIDVGFLKRLGPDTWVIVELSDGRVD